MIPFFKSPTTEYTTKIIESNINKHSLNTLFFATFITLFSFCYSGQTHRTDSSFYFICGLVSFYFPCTHHAPLCILYVFIKIICNAKESNALPWMTYKISLTSCNGHIKYRKYIFWFIVIGEISWEDACCYMHFMGGSTFD